MHAASLPSLMPIPVHSDSRGVFSKPLTASMGTELDFRITELFWTTSSIGVVRGMHFQIPPVAVNKLVWVSQGSIIDVVVDVRAHAAFGTVAAFALDVGIPNALWIPAGFAHGFQALEDDTIVNYAVDAPYLPEFDTGIRWDSIEFDWPLPIGTISERDGQLPTLAEFDSPFEVSP